MRVPDSRQAFGPFLLDRGRRVLLREGQPVALTPKAFDILSTLVESAGTVVTRDELQRACAERDVGLTFLRANPRWRRLADGPRFAEIERCVNLPPEVGRERGR